VHVAVIGLTIIWTLPSLGLLINSLRPEEAATSTGWWTVLQTPFTFTQFTLGNYSSVLTQQGLGQAFLNSLTIAVPATLIPILAASFAAYAFAWLDFPGRQLLFVVVVGLLVVPLQMTLIPILRIYANLRINGTFLAVWLAHTAYGLPFSIYLMRNFIGGLPKDIIESALLDGASQIQIFFRLVMPLSVPALASLGTFQFLWVWNDLLVALVYLGGTRDVAPLTVAISNLVNSLGQGWHLLTAAAFVSMALPVVVFLFLQRYFIRGLMAGAVKG
jgi:alpha-glucoside transport system permease protein